jgi:hypothetical protein
LKTHTLFVETSSVKEKKRLGNEGVEEEENNIKVDIKKIGRECVEWFHVAKDRVQWRALANTVMKGGGLS